METLRAQLLGAARITVSARSLTFVDDKRYQLLAYLACKADWVGREQLAFLFWPETDTQNARKNLRHLIQRVRGLDWLEGFDAEVEHLRWLVSSDVTEFRHALEQSDWDEALALYGGPLLDGVQADDSPGFAHWLESERASLQDRWRAAALHQARTLQEHGEHAGALHVLESLLEHDPLDEDALDQFMHTAAEAGQRGTALRAFEGFARRLDQELNLPPPTNLERLAASIRAHEAAPMQSTLVQVAVVDRLVDASPSARPLPLSLTPFVGRELVLAELTNALEERKHHLITLVGPGGVGKTRVALQIAHEQRVHQDVGFVNLVPLSTPSAIPTAMADTIGLSLKGKDAPLVQVIQHIGARRMLLVIDNFEHLITGGTYLNELLQQCPNLVMLVTSREPLGLLGEQVLPIEAFPVPENTAVRPEDIPSLEAVQLFVQHARRVRPDFHLSEENMTPVLEVCRLVDGLPLGIELAAVWVRALPVAEIAAEIAGNLDALESRSTGLAERHHSIRAAFEHTWGLLTPEEQRALRWLSVFRGGFSREAVRQAARIPLPVLGSLIDKSLLGLNTQGRYRRHRLLHQFTQEKLAENPSEAATARAQHGEYYFGVLQNGLDGIRGPRSRAALEMLETELENIRAAWRWAVDGHRLQRLKAGTEALMRFFDARGRFLEAIDLFGEAIAKLSEDEPADRATLGTLLAHQSKFYGRRGQHETAERIAAHGLRLLTNTDEREALIWGRGNLAASIHARGQQVLALEHRQQALTEARTLGNERLIAVCLGWVAISEDDLGNRAQARQHYREAIHLFKKMGNHIGVLFNLSNLAGVMFDLGELEESRVLLHEAIDLAQTAGEISQMPGILTALGATYRTLGDLDQALVYTQRALESERDQKSENHNDQISLLVALAEISLTRSEPAQARTYLAEALGRAWDAQHLQSAMGILLTWAERLASDDAILLAQLASVVHQHPATRSADREWAKTLLETRGLTVPDMASPPDPLYLEALVRQLRFG